MILIILTQPSKKEEFESIGTMFLFSFLKQHRIQTYFSLNMLEYFFNISEDLKISINFLSMRMHIVLQNSDDDTNFFSLISGANARRNLFKLK